MINTNLQDYIKVNYKSGIPIFPEDLVDEFSTAKGDLKELLKEGKIGTRYGVYYRNDKDVPLTPDIVLEYKYIGRNGKVWGYLSGNSFAPATYITTQFSFTMNITSNMVQTDSVESYSLGFADYCLYKPRTIITDENWKVLQYLDIVADYEKYSMYSLKPTSKYLRGYIERAGLSIDMIKEYLPFYPECTKTLKELRLDDILA